MELKQWARVLRGRWRVLLLCILLGGGAGAAYAWTRKPVYAAHTQMFISTVGSPSDLSQTYQGGLFAQQRVLSYTTIVSSPPVLQTVISRLGLPETIPALQKKITATVPQGTVLMNVSVEDHSAQRAVQIASTLDSVFPAYVSTLESSQPTTGRRGSPRSSVKVSVVAPPELPRSPVSPRKPLDVGLGVLIGLVVGVTLAVLREYWDRRIRDADDACAILHAPLIGSIPEDPKARKRPLVVEDDPHSIVAESYRQLRTNLQFGAGDHRARSLIVCSAVPSEGKTVVAANLSVALAQAGLRVILVDADLRLPRVGSLFGLDNSKGLADALREENRFEQRWDHLARLLLAHPSLPLSVLPSGAPPPNPAELLEEFPAVLEALQQQADIVIVDSPALLPVADGAILARAAAGVIMVTRVASTRAKQLEAANRALGLVDAEVIGVVANFVSRSAAYGRRYGRYTYAPPPDGRQAAPPVQPPREAPDVQGISGAPRH